MSNNVLYITYDGLTDPLGQSQILPYIIGLSKKGYTFTIISAEKAESFKNQKLKISELCNKNGIDWHPVKYTKKPLIISTLIDVATIKKTAFKLHRKKQFKAVHCRSYIAAIIGQSMKQKKGVKFIFDMRGFWADERYDGGIWDKSKVHYRVIYSYFKNKEKQFLQNADAIVSLTHKGKEIMQNQWNVKTPTFVIPCAVDTILFKPIKKDTSQNKKLILGYLGSIGTWYMLDEMLDFFIVLLQKYPKAKFKFITAENRTVILNRAISKNISTDKLIIISAQRENVPEELKKIDLGIFFIKPLFSKNASSPVKQGEFMSMGIPVITNSGIGDTDEIITKYQSGILISNFDKNDYNKAIDKIDYLLNMSKEVFLKGTNDYFSLHKGVENYFLMYNFVIFKNHALINEFNL